MGIAHSSKSLTPEEFDELVQSTSFTSAQIEEWYEKFKKDFPKGYISQKEFKAVYIKMFPHGDADKFCNHIFRVYDVDASNTISFDEFITTLHVSSRGTPEEKLGASFRMYDIDRNGYVTIEEITQILVAIYRSRGDKAAKDQAIKDAATIMVQLDANNDKKLSQQEFISAATSFPLVLAILQGKGTE